MATDTAEEQALLMELARLGMGMAQRLHEAALATKDTGELVALANAYHRVSRGMRQSLALKARFAAGTVAPERAAPPEAASVPGSDRDAGRETERPDWNERADWNERPDWHTAIRAEADEALDADPEVCRARIRRDLTVVSRTPVLAAIPALQAPAAALAGRAALLGGASLKLVNTS